MMTSPSNPLDIDSVSRCKKCPGLGRDHVPSDGSPSAAVMFVGRDPGKVEVRLGRPFAGPCGDILNYVLDEAILSREDVYIANAVKCHTPNNRGPHQEELATCSRQWLTPEMQGIKPRVLVVFGKDAHESVFRGKVPFKHLATVKGSSKRIAIMAWHPGYVLRRSDLLQEYISGLGAAIKKALEDTE